MNSKKTVQIICTILISAMLLACAGAKKAVASSSEYSLAGVKNAEGSRGLDKNKLAKMGATVENVSFKSGENTLQGMLLIPKNSNGKALTIVGPISFVKEQSPLQYAKILLEYGFTSIIFDPTYFGSSEGTPRRHDSGDQKTRDIIASIDFLNARNDEWEIYGLGVCQGVNWMIKAASQDERITAVGLVAGHYLTPTVARYSTNGDYEGRLAAADKALKDFEQNQTVEYIPFVAQGNGGSGGDAMIPWQVYYDWYTPWETNEGDRGGKWENRVTRMSEAEMWRTDIRPEIQNLQKPVIVIHADLAATDGDTVKTLFQSIKSENKKLVWFGNTFQTLFYDDAETVGRGSKEIASFLESL